MRVLHLSHHQGCLADFAEVGHLLGFEVESATFDDGYNIGPDRATRAWRRWSARLNAADVVLISDTAPLARIVLDHLDDFRGTLVVWVCNRFDYADQATNDCGFPDDDYYALVRRARGDPRVEFVSYTPFEIIYAHEKGVDLGTEVIRPLGLRSRQQIESPVPTAIQRETTVLVPPYHNDELFHLAGHCQSAGVNAYRGRYAGAQDAGTFKAIAHVPYAWSTLAFFEHLQNAMVTFVPSLAFFRELSKTERFFWPDYRTGYLELAEWFSPAHDFLVRFESWGHLRHLLRTVDFASVRASTRKAALRHTHVTLCAWDRLFARIGARRVGASHPPAVLAPARSAEDSAVSAVERLIPFRDSLEAHGAVASCGEEPNGAPRLAF